ncbi:hypothetical protein J4E81_006030 [Alternaria sp. BMP 2799]|nr:hypothetical protein J4E81_006030 [Alternaria sp. BMP 2799]
MQFPTMLSTLFIFASVLTSSIAIAAEALPPVAHVTDCNGKTYMLDTTGQNNIRVITQDRADGYYIQPVSYHVDSGTTCNFYSESTRGVGYPIGKYYGPVDGDFVGDWAAFYECWDVESEIESLTRRRGRSSRA